MPTCSTVAQGGAQRSEQYLEARNVTKGWFDSFFGSLASAFTINRGFFDLGAHGFTLGASDIINIPGGEKAALYVPLELQSNFFRKEERVGNGSYMKIVGGNELYYTVDQRLRAFRLTKVVTHSSPTTPVTPPVVSGPLPPPPAPASVWAGASAAALDSGNRYAGAVVETFKFWKWPQAFSDF